MTHARPLAIVALVAVVVATAAGCNSSGGGAAAGTSKDGARAISATGTEMRAQAMAAADGYVLTVVQALDELHERTRKTRPDIADWALMHKIATANAAFTSATQTSDAGSLLDMLVLARLKRLAVEEYWVPHLLKDDGLGLLAAQKQAEADVWADGEKALTRKQLDELLMLIEQWRREHPTQYYVGYVRIADIAAEKKNSQQVKLPGSVFGLLYLDPLSGLDPVAAELRSYRALTERMMFLATRMPLIIAAQVERATGNATSTPEVLRFLDGIDKFNQATSRFTDNTSRFTDNTGRFADSIGQFTETAKKYPEQLSGERKAAIDQMNAAVTEQRQAILAELDAQESRLHRVMQDAKSVLDRADSAGVSINRSTTQTVTSAELSTRRTLDHAFRLTLVLILLLLVGIPTSAFLYRRAAAREPQRDRSPRSAA